MKSKEIKIALLALLVITLLGAFLRFYKLDWGQGLFTHPDEYHIAISVNQLSFPSQMDPNFFSYGTVTIYLIYFTKLFLSTLYTKYLILNTFLIGRFYSALFSTLTILLVYGISRKFLNSRYSLLAAFLTALTPGLIQQAHFATPESALTFFLFGSLYFLLKFTQKPLYSYFLILTAVFFGLALGVKVSSAVFLLPLLLGVYLAKPKPLISLITPISLITLISLATFFIVDPYVFFDWPHFWNSFNYESSLARGMLPVFYTRQFIDTTPVIFQLTKVLPYALGPALLISGFLGLAVISFETVKKRNFPGVLLLASFLSLFLFNSFLFAKWTRFLAPTFPFFAIFSAFLLYKVSRLKLPRSLPLILNSIFLILSLLWALAFFSIYLTPDVRLSASQWLKSNTPPAATFLVEGGNMVDIPLSGDFKRVSLDFYDLENDAKARQKIVENLASTDYFIIESRRVFSNHGRLPEQFPKTARFYRALFDGKAGFTKVQEFHSYPELNLGPPAGGWSFEIPDEGAEETWSVFDHPVIRIFQKNAKLTKDDYAKLFEN